MSKSPPWSEKSLGGKSISMNMKTSSNVSANSEDGGKADAFVISNANANLNIGRKRKGVKGGFSVKESTEVLADSGATVEGKGSADAKVDGNVDVKVTGFKSGSLGKAVSRGKTKEMKKNSLATKRKGKSKRKGKRSNRKGMESKRKGEKSVKGRRSRRKGIARSRRKHRRHGRSSRRWRRSRRHVRRQRPGHGQGESVATATIKSNSIHVFLVKWCNERSLYATPFATWFGTLLYGFMF